MTLIPHERPFIPYEHPTAKTYLYLFKENIIRQCYRKKRLTTHDKTIQQTFSQSSLSLQDKCQQLLQYTLAGFTHYAVKDYTRAYYPGRASQQSANTDAIEGVSRVTPLFAAWLNKQSQPNLSDLSGKVHNIADLLTRCFLAGTNPNHKGYWGKVNDYDQRICESADLALTLWLSRKWVWDTLSPEQQQMISTWFRQIPLLKTVDNNWHLFVLTVEFVLHELTGEGAITMERYQRIKDFYVGNGWFRDGAKGNFDYYNAWGFYYSLYWLDQINPQFDHDFIKEAINAFSQNFITFFTDTGLPFFGRSLCYRLAAPCPLLCALDYQPPAERIGQIKRTFQVTLDYFISHGALRYGAPTQGLFHDDGRLVDNYSGPASSFWSLRSLTVALYNGEQTGLWQSEERPLPIEQHDFEFSITEIDAKIIGTHATNEVVVIFQSEYTHDQSPETRILEKQRISAKLMEWFTGRAFRPKNNLLRKGVTCYSSKMTHFF